MTELGDLQQTWTALGEQDPLWAILSFPEKRGGRWDLEEFFATGRPNVDEVLGMIAKRGIAIDFGRALDFGCGVGRLTRALAERFDSCDGVDVAASMIERARALNKDGDRVRFHHNEATDLRLFGDESFDFVLSLIVLQHMEPELMRGYMREFVRVLRPGGVAFFNVPESFYDEDVEALPPEAWRASLTLVGEIPSLIAGRVAPLRVMVRNESPVAWPTAARVRVGDHWRHPDGTMFVLDDARTEIWPAVSPAGEYELQLDVCAPLRPGEYQLEVDLVQEGIGWFADRGSSTLRLPVTVAPEPEQSVDREAAAAERQPNESGQDKPMPAFEMHAMPREEVVATLENAGGVVLDVIESWRRGRAVPAVAYIVARAVAPVQIRSRPEPGYSQAMIEAPIYSPGLERRARALRLMDERADLIGFGLTSSLKGLGGASTAFREALRRAMFQVLHRQTEYNRASDELIRSHEKLLAALDATVKAQLDIQVEAEARLAALERRVVLAELSSVVLRRRAARGAPQVGPLHIANTALSEQAPSSAEDVRENQRTYVSYFNGCSDVVDAGCGRGEFLELLRESGISAVGVDSDELMVIQCRERGLDVVQGEALHFLRGRPEDSQGGIFAGHLVEHLERGGILELVRLAFSRLRPGGVLVIETVNPMCLLTYATFYEDFTQRGPVPPQALERLAEACGFASVKIEYASPVAAESKLRPLPTSNGDEADVEAFNHGIEAANEALFGFQEYALVATKPS